uniref:Uncharacterized protein n=1 Tax=Arundo donax TaxID=35708 RepID=A0A0A9D223_ARUDO
MMILSFLHLSRSRPISHYCQILAAMYN